MQILFCVAFLSVSCEINSKNKIRYGLVITKIKKKNTTPNLGPALSNRKNKYLISVKIYEPLYSLI